MIYLKTYNLFERKDLKKSNEIEKTSKDIVSLIKQHFIDVIENDDIEKISKLKYNDLTIVMEPNNNISFAVDKKENFFLNVGFDTLLDIIDDIKKNISDVENRLITLNKIKNMDLYSEFFHFERIALTHELTHMKDNDIFNIFKMVLYKIIDKSSNMSYDDLKKEYSKNPDNYIGKYMDIYTNLETEYNAFFMAALQEMKKDAKENKNILSNFNHFHDIFLQEIQAQNSDLYQGKFKKHIDKRIYDAFVKFNSEI